MEIKGKQITFIGEVADKLSSMDLYSIGFKKVETEHYWVDTSVRFDWQWINYNNMTTWTLMSKQELEEQGVILSSHDFDRISYSAPTQEEILIWKLKNS